MSLILADLISIVLYASAMFFAVGLGASTKSGDSERQQKATAIIVVILFTAAALIQLFLT